MKKNVVFIVNMFEEKRSGRSKGYEWSVKSWGNWCKKNDCELFVLDDRVYDEDFMNANWHKTLVLELLEANNISYDQAAVVDCDTIVHPDTPNFFKESERKLKNEKRPQSNLLTLVTRLMKVFLVSPKIWTKRKSLEF